MKLLTAALLALSLLPAAAFAVESPEDMKTCDALIPDLVFVLRQRVQAYTLKQMSYELMIAYEAQHIPLNESQIHFVSQTTGISDEPWGIWVKLEAHVDAGADSADFLVESKMPVSNERSLFARTQRETEYDAIGRQISTRLLCTMSNVVPSWEMPLTNKATGHVIDNHYAAGDISAQIVRP